MKKILFVFTPQLKRIAMSNGKFDDEIWNEHQWETHLNEIERKSEQLRKFIASDSPNNIPRWLTLLKENTDKLDAVDAYIEEELQIEDAYFPEDEEWDDEFDDEMDDYFFDEFEDDFFFDEFDDEDFDAGEEWKELSNDFTRSDNGSIENLQVYNRARELSVYILQWAEDIHPKIRNEACTDFVGKALKIGAKLASGYSFGFEQDFLGANIACTKKALQAANDALNILGNELQKASFINKPQYKFMHEQLFELRNDIGIYVQELREKFYFGFE